jgi:transposase
MLAKLKPADQSGYRAPLRVLKGGSAETQPVTLDRLVGWYRRHFDLLGALEGVTDGRVASRVQVPLPTLLLAVVVGFWVGIKSVSELADRLRHNVGLRALLGRLTGYERPFCDDTVRDTVAKLDPGELRALVHAQCQRGTQQWGARHYVECELASRLRPINSSHLAAKLVVAIDGHELFSSPTRCCKDCRVRNKTVERGGKKVTVVEYYHTLVVAFWVGTHPGLVLDFEPVPPGKGELSTAYKLLERLGRVYGKAIGIVLADALYDCEPWRALAQKQNYRVVHAQKDKRRDPGHSARRALDRRDPERRNPDWTHRDPVAHDVYRVWEQSIAEGARRYIDATRTSRDGTVHRVTLVTDLPMEMANAVAVVRLYEVRWWIENTAFHELQGQWALGHAYVHKGRPAAVLAYVTLGILAFNAMQMYVYRHLHRQPGANPRPLIAYRHDLRETMILCSRKASARADDPANARAP